MSDLAVLFENVGKMYKVYGSRRDNLFDALGIDHFMPTRRSRYGEFWALRGVDFALPRGGRLGVIGRNGAGKSTLLKLVTQNLAPTEGLVSVHGSVQALLDVGSGLHPEFTGRENILASLGLLGLTRAEIEAATEDIADFTELGRFLDQPFKTYSMGMQARLGIGVATTVKPEILIIDEILGAGDAYFFAKSTARMHELLSEGASVLLVSHALDQIARFCDESLWLDRGRVVMRGETSEVIKAYEKFSRDLEDRRLQAKNRKTGGFDAFARDSYTASLEVRISAPDGSACEVAALELLRNGDAEERIDVGSAQDGDKTHAAHLVLDEAWGKVASDPAGGYLRTVVPGSPATASFNLWFLYPDSDYSIGVRYRSPDTAVSVEVLQGERPVGFGSLPASDHWRDAELPVTSAEELEGSGAEDTATTASRWSGSASLMIESVRLLDSDGNERGVFNVGDPLVVDVDIVAREGGTFPLIPAALTFHNGVVTTRHVGAPTSLSLTKGEHVSARLYLGALLLGNGTYLLSLGLYSSLDVEDLEPSEFYDYFDKSFEFSVVGNPRLHNELVRHPGDWIVVPASSREYEEREAVSS